jgi:hypothetical protein
MKSWKTTLLGILQLVTLVLGAVLAFKQSPDGKPVINPQIMMWAALVQSVLLAVKGWVTRDNDVSSEDAGAK